MPHKSSFVVPALTAALLGTFALTACGSAPPPPPNPAPEPDVEPEDDEPFVEEPEEVESGIDCVKAEALCEMAVCTVDIDNQCEQPATCELEVSTTCKLATDMIEATGRSRGTIPAKSKDEMRAVGDCIEGNVVATRVTALKCR